VSPVAIDANPARNVMLTQPVSYSSAANRVSCPDSPASMWVRRAALMGVPPPAPATQVCTT
jgi:hypothetical protein